MAKAKAYVLGLDFGTNSARALIVDPANGKEIATAVAGYPSGEAGHHPRPPKTPTSPGRIPATG